MVEAAGEIAQRPLGLVGIVEFPGLPQRPAHGGMQRVFEIPPMGGCELRSHAEAMAALYHALGTSRVSDETRSGSADGRRRDIRNSGPGVGQEIINNGGGIGDEATVFSFCLWFQKISDSCQPASFFLRCATRARAPAASTDQSRARSGNIASQNRCARRVDRRTI
jgi:hypothetical protein